MGLFILILFMFVLAVYPTGLALGKFLDGRDIRKFGTGNIGGTNIARVYGWFWGILVMILDALKAALVVSLVESGPFQDVQSIDLFTIKIIVGALVILLNIFNPFLGFKGGKGIATAIGVIFELDWEIALLAFGSFLIMLGIHKFKKNDLFKASLTGTCAAFACSIALSRPAPEIILLGIAVPIIFFSHRENIRKFLENKKPLS